MKDDQQACAHSRIVLKPIQNENGTWRDYWGCKDCDAEFWPAAMIEQKVEEAFLKRTPTARITAEPPVIHWVPPLAAQRPTFKIPLWLRLPGYIVVSIYAIVCVVYWAACR